MTKWQMLLHAAYKQVRPRNPNYLPAFYTDYDEREGFGNIELWRTGVPKPQDCHTEVVEGATWYGFVDHNVPHELTAELAVQHVRALFAKFGD